MKKKTIRKLTIFLTIIMLIGSSSVFAGDASAVSVPPDVAGTPYEAAVKALVEKEIITGDTDGNFYPNANLTRAQACIIVVKSMNPPAAEVTGTATQPVGKSGFSDMSGYGWAEGYIKYAVEYGVTKGYPDGSFKPGNKVTTNELITMVLRATGFNDASLGGTWPANYVNKAAELKLLENIPSPLPTLATKGIAAQLDFDALSRIEAANPPKETSQTADKPKSIPDAKSMAYANGSFDSTMTTYNGKTISKDVTVYTYGEKKSYSSTMTFSNKLSDYGKETVYKYKNVKTPAFYKLTGDKITEMIVPMDVGFSGKAYCVVNDTITAVNGKGEAVPGLVTLTATKEITWLGEKGMSFPAFAQGELYELNLSDGEIQSIYKSTDAEKKGAKFEEISGAIEIFDEVASFDDSTVAITVDDGGAMFKVKDNASVYVIDENDPTKYKAGRISSIRAGAKVRAYDISDDKESSADIVIVLR